MLPKAPLDARNAPAAVWTGSEMLLWGGHSAGVDHRDGAAFDPLADTWRSITDAPMQSAGRPVAVWTGTEMVVLAGFNSRRAAAYDPEVGTWRPLPDLPAQLQAPTPVVVWTGSDVVVVTGTPTSGAAVYSLDPGAGTWTELPSLAGGQIRLVWTGGRLLAIADRIAAVLVPNGDGWDEVARAPGEATIADSDAFWTGSEALLWAGGGTAVIIDPVHGTWTGTAAREGGRVQAASVWADGVLVAWGGFPGRADGLVLRPPHSVAAPAPGPVTAPTTLPPVLPDRECAGTRMPAPPPAASFEVVGRTGNEWQLNVGAEGVTVKVRITQKQDTKVSGLRFEIAPDGESWPGRTIRRISVAEPLSEGVNEVSVRWDGRNEEGDRAPPGLYRLYATVTGSGQREVTCADGSGRGFERFEGTSGGGLGTLIVE